MRSKAKSRGSANDSGTGKPVKRRRKKPCIFCEGKPNLDYKDIPSVRKFLSDRAKILARRTTGCCALHQRMVAKTIKRARQISLIPYTLD
ncbi:30S ribosomal protein S18 [Candidatus Saganbacteria bacterium]|nr:30S ribosomal protein S18 [Candidatus Saganbacteria bacterium]